MNCDACRNQLGEFIVGALESDDAVLVERHLEACDVCSRELLEIERLEGALSDSRQVRPRTFWSRSFAAAAGLAALGLLAVWFSGRTVEPVLLGGRVAEAPAPTGKGRVLPFSTRLSVLEPSRLALPDGSLVEAFPGARLRFDGPRHARVEAGNAFFKVARAG
ncbi:MAG TPA: zf-HC2 domain-containing protein, partial [Planctomycetota bacterium]|nr:zf-HC2 domain-containing protein [Planctomycetota bacterium]